MGHPPAAVARHRSTRRWSRNCAEGEQHGGAARRGDAKHDEARLQGVVLREQRRAPRGEPRESGGALALRLFGLAFGWLFLERLSVGVSVSRHKTHDALIVPFALEVGNPARRDAHRRLGSARGSREGVGLQAHLVPSCSNIIVGYPLMLYGLTSPGCAVPSTRPTCAILGDPRWKWSATFS
eukprot:3916813-Prymnesium_polylepis.2